MNWQYLLLLITIVSCYPKLPCVTSDGNCPDYLECAIKAPEDCNEGYFKPNISDCGCCPACIKYLERGEDCHGINIPPLYECGNDLVCSQRTGTCVPPSAESPLIEEALYSSKESKFSQNNCLEANQSTIGYHPKCTKDGSFTPKQCQDDLCFCVTVEGKPITRYKIPVKQAEQMECVCARVEAERNSGRMCDEFGNYKTI
ncbi:hypothetical protein L9F63_002182 [Diploptera punctata]|uniref:Thyroglobulin type-1 domain-containing protein n=1 Tax=Diploptera punctata TaxID=6984 RepID=A0AAD8A2G6_DIPPU|nr:hypothetical protein L9F63_002182 [Diploptera punctata]